MNLDDLKRQRERLDMMLRIVHAYAMLMFFYMVAKLL
jgi:hypothetical protein